MDHLARAFDVQTPSRRGNSGPSEARRARMAKANPRSRGVNRSARADAYSAFADEVRRDLNPRGPLESILADHVVSSAWRLKAAVGRQAARALAECDKSDQPEKAASPTAADRAARSVTEALESLDRVRQTLARRGADAPVAYPGAAFECLIEPNEWPIIPFEATDEPDDDAPGIEVEDEPIWRDRLSYDFEVSDISPVVKGTWITVGHVVSLVVDGYSWADILRSHPELTEDDIRSCVAFAVAQDQDED